MLVLLAEDNDIYRDAVCLELARCESFNVHAVSDGLAALEFLQTVKEPVFLVTDMCMPRMTGYELIRAIVEQKLPVIGCLILSSLLASHPLIVHSLFLMSDHSLSGTMIDKVFDDEALCQVISRLTTESQ
jgi:CheY-like chemotaxis protein